MAKLNTPFHDCVRTYLVPTTGQHLGCQYAAYKRIDKQWLCKMHLRMARRR
jgi:hypothetical protein